METEIEKLMIMIDIETTGVDLAKDDVIQIGMVPMEFVGGYWQAGAIPPFNLRLHTDKVPTSVFAREHMVKAYEVSNSEPYKTPEEVRHEILNFFDHCGLTSPEVYFAGWNAGFFDLPFLVAKNYLVPSNYITVGGKQVMTGDFHYRIYDIQGATGLMEDILKIDRKELQKRMDAQPATIPLPEGLDHDAVYDCYKQIDALNKLIRLGREYCQDGSSA